MYLADEMTGSVAMIEGPRASTTEFGLVEEDVLEAVGVGALAASATNFVHDTSHAVGILATNALNAVAKLVWSNAFTNLTETVDPGDGSAVAVTRTVYLVAEEDGTVTEWLPASDVPERATTIACLPFAVSALAKQPDGTWLLTLTNGVRYCTYTLYAIDDLADAADATKWRQSGAAKKLTDELDALGTFTFSAEASGAKTFWKVLGEDGEEAN